MDINYIHGFDFTHIDDFKSIQDELRKQIYLRNTFSFDHVEFVAGVDISYWEKDGVQYGACSIVVVNYRTKKSVKKISSFGTVTVPYIPGFLAFRELPLFLETVKKLSYNPDIFIFDGNGYLHGNCMGIATHASFFINTPTIGVAKSYYRLDNIDYEMPENKIFAHSDIIVNDEVRGRALRTKKDVKPIFVSCGNYIDLDTSTKITCHLVNQISRVPIPTRLADLETNELRRYLSQ